MSTSAHTDRVSQIPRCALDGHSRRYIAEQLFASENTANAHLKKIYAKMRVHSNKGLWHDLPVRWRGGSLPHDFIIIAACDSGAPEAIATRNAV